MNSILSDPAFWSRFQFGFTLIYHYLFPQLTMGLAWVLVYWKWRAWVRSPLHIIVALNATVAPSAKTLTPGFATLLRSFQFIVSRHVAAGIKKKGSVKVQ